MDKDKLRKRGVQLAGWASAKDRSPRQRATLTAATARSTIFCCALRRKPLIIMDSRKAIEIF
jgi:hypothetical protein